MLDNVLDAMTQLTSIWNEVNTPATIERYTVLPTSETLHDSECPICQEDYDDDEHVAIKLVGTHCSHVFGQNCLQEWVDSGENNAHYCPSCRQSIHGAFSGWQEGDEQRDRHWAKASEVNDLLQELETALVPPVESGDQASQPLQIVRTLYSAQDEDRILREILDFLSDQSKNLKELLRRNLQRQVEIRERNLRRAEATLWAVNYRRM